MRLLIVAGLLASGPVLATPEVQVDYMLNCQGCHLPDGSGFEARKVPDFNGQLGRYLQVPGGREYLARVPGAAQAGISDQRLAQLLNWLLQRYAANEIPASFVPYTAEEVGPWRRKPYAAPEVVRAELLSQLAIQQSKQ